MRAPRGYTDPVCKYIGKLDLTEALGKHEELIAPVRGSVIGGSAIVDSELVGQVGPRPPHSVSRDGACLAPWVAELLRSIALSPHVSGLDLMSSKRPCQISADLAKFENPVATHRQAYRIKVADSC